MRELAIAYRVEVLVLVDNATDIDPAPERAVSILTNEWRFPANKLTIHAASLDAESAIERMISAKSSGF